IYKNASKEKTMLFNLAEDAYERNDLAQEEPAVLADLEAEYQAWDAQNQVPGWVDPHIENCKRDEARWRQDRGRALPPRNLK
ncbi:MAG: N-acetylgalactosamine-6-sulfatase, partial [Bacteroidota bacterium]